ncbi:molybdopterin-dependent oxidoreductase [Ramlibacter sp.]|uniref:molybdopterin-dependent oxidoreductase n=1 Tax=Ramlibacter sp. TaxID=1917967 RepID=UPI002FC9F497
MKKDWKPLLLVNGDKRELGACGGGRRLVDVLRDDLELTGTKVGCNAGDCGACTVLVDGQQVCSCLVPVAHAAGKPVMTVEGIARDKRLAGLQDAFVEAGAAQCGICTPGMLVAAADIVLDPAVRTREAILDRLGGVLCRCTGYIKIVEAIEGYLGLRPRVAAEKAGAGQSVGARIRKVDGAARADGSAKFGADVRMEGALHFKAIRSPHPHAKFRLGDLGGFVSRHPGIVRVFTAADVPGNNVYGIFARLRDQPVFSDGYVRYMGEAFAGVVGEREAIEALEERDFPVTWEVLPPLSGMAAALAPDAPDLHAHRPGNQLMEVNQIRGDVGKSRGSNTATISFVTSFVEHAYIEPEAGVARRVGDRLEIAVSTQAPYMNRDEIAWVLGIAPDRVRVLPTAVGGGFGGKIDMSLQPMIAVAAWHLDRPVACVYSRSESMRCTTKRHPSAITATLTCDAQGRLATYEMRGDFNTGPYSSCGPIIASRVPIHAMGPYKFEAVRCITRAIHTTDAIGGAFRGFGVPQAAVVHEALMDRLADDMGIDRFEFRLRNALRPGDATATGQKLEHSVGMLECLQKLKPVWDAQKAEVQAFNAANEHVRRGIGVGCMWYGIGNTSQPNPSTMRIGIDREGRITLFSGAVDIGQGVNTIMTQVCADSLGVEPAAIRLVVGDTDRTFDAGKSSASRQAFISGNAVKLAAEQLLKGIRQHAKVEEGAQVSFGPGGVRLKTAAGEKALDLSGLVPDAEGMLLWGVGHYNPPTTDLDADYQGVPYATYAFGAQMALVEVDKRLCKVTVKKIWAAHDVGRAINPTQVEGQIHGGIAQGVGLALMEEYLPGKTDNLHDYLIPTVGDMPEVEVFIVESAEPLGPFGAKGVGEPALIPTAPAILNAVDFACGVRPTLVPLTPSRLADLLDKAPA